VTRIYQPVPIQYFEAIIVAAIGLGVNVVSALMLQDSDQHDHEDEAGLRRRQDAPHQRGGRPAHQ
jgi:Co/Zn/Cd efflux system component